MATTSLLQRVRHRINRENELVVDPAFFVALKQRFPGIHHIDLQLKRGRYHHEMTRFRYDIIHINYERVQNQEDAFSSVKELRQLLQEPSSSMEKKSNYSGLLGTCQRVSNPVK